jgi:geranylgeranyl transferase type-2 subunit beta
LEVKFFIIFKCQDEDGGIADRPHNQPDVFHTFFGLAALSLLNGEKYQLNPIDPAFALPRSVLALIPGALPFI